MARRAIWKGAISFGMVAIPIKLYLATESKDIAFGSLHKTCNTRIKMKRYCPHHDADVELSEIVKGYEYAKEQYLVMESGDFENLPVPSTHTIEIVRFIDLSSIDPINFDRTYVLEPDNVGTKPFYLLKQALENTNRAAIAKISIRQKEHICCLRPFDSAIALQTMHYPDEIRGTTDLNLPEDQTAITEQEMAMATMLIDQLTGPYEPATYRDDYRLALERVIEAKLSSEQPVTAAPPRSRQGQDRRPHGGPEGQHRGNEEPGCQVPGRCRRTRAAGQRDQGEKEVESHVLSRQRPTVVGGCAGRLVETGGSRTPRPEDSR